MTREPQQERSRRTLENLLEATIRTLHEGGLDGATIPRIAEAAGVSREAVLEILGEGAAGSRLLKTKLPMMFKRDFTPQFQLQLMEKDLRYFVGLASELDRPAPIAALVRSQYQAARRASLGALARNVVRRAIAAGILAPAPT